jgi:SP family myo-inositol transporter-like MFS transporter 13
LIQERKGRKRLILYSDVAFVSGSLLLAASTSAVELILGRLVVGLAVGIASMVVPVYIAEIAPKDLRAAMVSVNVLSITSGQFFSYLVNYWLSFTGNDCWRAMLGVAAVPAVLQFIGISLLDESPRYLLQTGQLERAKQVMMKLTGGDLIDSEMLEEENRDEQNAGAKSQIELGGKSETTAFKKKLFCYQLHIGVGLQILQQLSGINTIMYFTPVLLSSAGFGVGRKAILISLLPAATNALATLIGIWAIERFGRRRLLMSSLGAVACTLLLIGVLFNAQARYHDNHHDESADASTRDPFTIWIVASLMLYLVAFAPGLAPVPWAINSEIYPPSKRAFGNGSASVANWMSNSLISILFLRLQHLLGPGGVFWLCSAIATSGLAWVYFVLPETRGLSFAEIQNKFAARLKATRRFSTSTD